MCEYLFKILNSRNILKFPLLMKRTRKFILLKNFISIHAILYMYVVYIIFNVIINKNQQCNNYLYNEQKQIKLCFVHWKYYINCIILTLLKCDCPSLHDLTAEILTTLKYLFEIQMQCDFVLFIDTGSSREYYRIPIKMFVFTIL